MPVATRIESSAKPRIPLTKERVLRAAIALADEGGIESLSMRKLGQELGVEAMSLYNHVENKEDILDGMVDTLASEIELTLGDADWRSAMRDQILAARVVMARHPWAPAVIESRKTLSAPMMKYMDSVLGIFRQGGLSMDLSHHAMHVLGSRVLGFAQELYDDSQALEESPEVVAVMMKQMGSVYPNITALTEQITHDEATIIGSGCDDDVEFAFALDLILDGLERIRDAA